MKKEIIIKNIIINKMRIKFKKTINIKLQYLCLTYGKNKETIQ